MQPAAAWQPNAAHFLSPLRRFSMESVGAARAPVGREAPLRSDALSDFAPVLTGPTETAEGRRDTSRRGSADTRWEQNRHTANGDVWLSGSNESYTVCSPAYHSCFVYQMVKTTRSSKWRLIKESFSGTIPFFATFF